MNDNHRNDTNFHDTSFIALIHSLADSALASLGQHNALSARIERDGVKNADVAKRSLDLLKSLAVKTRGNLNLAESELLTGSIERVRLALAAANQEVS